MKTQSYLLLFVMLAVAHTQVLKVQTNRFAQPRNVSYDRVAVTIDGQRKFIISGAIHYPRSTPSMWPALFQRTVDAGINTLETYVFWNFHEPRRGEFDFSGNLDLLHFIELAATYKLDVILRIGPYICAEINYGGFPEWLKEIEGIQFRTYNQPFMTEMSKWVTKVVDMVRPQLASNGGPIILLQIENEYGSVIDYHGEGGKKYINWCIDFANSLKAGVPWIMCVGSAGNALDTVNGFYTTDDVLDHWKTHPEQPGLWTENWPGWFDAWAYAHNTRPVSDVAYAALRFFAVGGTGMNYYMWHGGTNFGRSAPSYLMATSYDYDAPLDEFGYPHQPKYNHLVAMHKVLLANQQYLLSDPGRPTPKPLGTNQFAYSYSDKFAFLCNDDENNTATVEFAGKSFTLSAWSVVLIDQSGTILFDSSKVVDKPTTREYKPFASDLSFQWWREPQAHPHREIIVPSDKPIEYLHLSHDTTDYTFYSRKFILNQDAKHVLLTSVADIAHIFIDGKYVNSTSFVLKNSRGKLDGKGFEQKVHIHDSLLHRGQHEITIMTTCIGLTKLETEIDGQNLADDKRGVWGSVFVGEQDITNGNWSIQLGTVGEHLQVYKFSSHVLWQNDVSKGTNQTVTWWKTSFKYQKGDHPVVIDLLGLKKGVAWINGNCIGRYNIMNSMAHGGFPPLVEEGFGKPVQRWYHVPQEWLHDQNELIFFEELGGTPVSVAASHVMYN